MKKIPTIFVRDSTTGLVKPDWNTDCLWVVRGEGWASKKYDGQCVMLRDGKYYKRRTWHIDLPRPDGFDEEHFDRCTNKAVGWVPADFDSKEDKWFADAVSNMRNGFFSSLEDGTYELCGPKINGNPEGFTGHILVLHETAERYHNVPREFTALSIWFSSMDIEGIVFYHSDGRRAKIKKKDFGQKR